MSRRWDHPSSSAMRVFAYIAASPMLRDSIAVVALSVALVACANGANGDVNPVPIDTGDEDAGLADVAQDVARAPAKVAATVSARASFA